MENSLMSESKVCQGNLAAEICFREDGEKDKIFCQNQSGLTCQKWGTAKIAFWSRVGKCPNSTLPALASATTSEPEKKLNPIKKAKRDRAGK